MWGGERLPSLRGELGGCVPSPGALLCCGAGTGGPELLLRAFPRELTVLPCVQAPRWGRGDPLRLLSVSGALAELASCLGLTGWWQHAGDRGCSRLCWVMAPRMDGHSGDMSPAQGGG